MSHYYNRQVSGQAENFSRDFFSNMDTVPPYSLFSHVYNQSMQTISYNRWVDFLMGECLRYRPHLPSRVLDLGCGTGKFLLAWEETWNRKYRKNVPDMGFRSISGKDWMDDSVVENGKGAPRIVFTGVDASVEMIAVARREAIGRDGLSWVVSRLEDYHTPTPFELIVSTHTTVNYLPDLRVFLDAADRSLLPDGLLFFDFTSRKNILQNFHNKKFTESLGGVDLQWETFFDESNSEILVRLDFFRSANLEWLGQEIHRQYFHELESIRELLFDGGYEIVSEGGDYTKGKKLKEADMCHFLVRKLPTPPQSGGVGIVPD